MGASLFQLLVALKIWYFFFVDVAQVISSLQFTFFINFYSIPNVIFFERALIPLDYLLFDGS